MLVRFIVENFLSFGHRQEFNMLPNSRYSRMEHHKYFQNEIEILKLSSIYGANAAGKSNLIKSIELLEKIVINEELPKRLEEKKFKFQKNLKEKPIVLAAEFLNDGTAFMYGIEIQEGLIQTEELYISGLGSVEDKLLFERKSKKDGSTSIKFFDDFYQESENVVLKNVIEKNLSKSNKPILKLLTTLKNPSLNLIVKAFNWFNEVLNIISPDSRPQLFSHFIDVDDDFKAYTKHLLCAFQVGISDVFTEKMSFNDFFGEDNLDVADKVQTRLEETPKAILPLLSKSGEEGVVVKEEDELVVKRLKLSHFGGEITALFNLDEESDGTIRLLDFVPAFHDVVNQEKVFIIDEIERSIHPLLIRELLRKFSEDKNTKGQLIFSTHESNLLDQNFMRKDEIWFVEKDFNGSSNIYTLSDFNEHPTIDIRKGYLNGRYGAIPFLANLKDLNWHKYDLIETEDI